jgi:uncharacterized membrane protein
MELEMINPFDLKTALLAKHAQHVVIIHFPIALSMSSLLFDLLAIWRKSPALATAAYYNLKAAAITSLLAIATGLIAWQWQFDGTKLKGNLLLHLIFGIVCSTLICILSWLRSRQQNEKHLPWGTIYLILGLVALLFIILAGHLGGILSGLNAAGATLWAGSFPLPLTER